MMGLSSLIQMRRKSVENEKGSAKAHLEPKSASKPGSTYLWLLLDTGGGFKAVCFEAPSVGAALSPGFMAKASAAGSQMIKASLDKSSPIITLT